MIERLTLILPWLVTLTVFVSGPALAAKTDLIYLNNGDRITCEIKSLQFGQLRVNTDSMGTIYIEWTDIDRIVSNQSLQLEMENGERLFGKLGELDEKRHLDVVVLDHSEDIVMDEVVRMEPIEVGKTWWRRLDGSISAGLDMEKTNNLFKWNLAADASLRTRKYLTSLNLSWDLTTQDELEDSDRASIGLAHQRFLANRWFRAFLVNASRNNETGIDLRLSAGGGIGRYLKQSNRSVFGLTGGVVVTNEQTISSADDTTSLEGLLRADWRIFQYKSPEINFNSALTVLPTLDSSGRVRATLDVNLRRELVNDLFFNVNLYTTYDNQPPEGASDSDYGLITSLGYSY